ncbi:putative toxin-antitoxin system, antitoxin component, ArsR family [Leptospira wolffii serovar Khorat str. Khorat-H2]|nr:putative toxin-antitoxin system, antitoxin component, ArsR family [Leptospira wolffii serovar Khorat str. Khorat-H2]
MELQNRSLSEASAWLAYHQEFWTNKLDRLEAFIEEQDHDRTGPKTRKKN